MFLSFLGDIDMFSHVLSRSWRVDLVDLFPNWPSRCEALQRQIGPLPRYWQMAGGRWLNETYSK